MATATFAYKVDSAEADQGVTGNGQSLKALVDSIGSENATIYFTHHGSASTTYDLDTSEEVPANITLVFQNGAIIDAVTGDEVLTVVHASQIQAAPNQQIFGSSITVVFTNGGEGYLNWWCDGGAGTTASPWTCAADSLAGISQAVASGLSVIRALEGEYSITTTYTLTTSSIIIQGQGITKTLINYTTTTGDIITVNAYNFDMRDLSIKGPAAKAGDEQALVFGTGSRHYLYRVGIWQVGGAALEIDSYYVSIQSCFFYDSADDLIRLNDTGGVVVIGGGTYITGAADKAINAIGNANHVQISDTNIEASVYGIYGAGASASARNLTLTNVHFEANSTSDIRGGLGLMNVVATNCRWGGNAGQVTTKAIDIDAATSCRFILNGGRFPDVAGAYTTTMISATGAGAKVIIVGTPWNLDETKIEEGGNDTVTRLDQLTVDPDGNLTVDGIITGSLSTNIVQTVRYSRRLDNITNNSTTAIFKATVVDAPLSGWATIIARRDAEVSSRIYQVHSDAAGVDVTKIGLGRDRNATIALTAAVSVADLTFTVDTTSNDWAGDDIAVTVTVDLTSPSGDIVYTDL